MHVLLLGDVITFAFTLFAAFAAIFFAAFSAAMASSPALSMGEDESDLVVQLQEIRDRMARISYEATYSRVMREVEAREAKQDAEWEAQNVSVESAAPVAARPPRGLVRPPTAEMRAAWARLSPPDEGFVPVVVSRTKVWDDLGVYSPFPPVVEWPGHTFPMTEGAISCV
jgi:hypothetical protein